MKKIQQYLRLKIKNSTTLAFIIWSLAIIPIVPSYSKMLSQEQNATEQIVAEQAKNAAITITETPNNKALLEAIQQHAITTANQMANKALTQWLPQYGNIKANLNIDRDLSLKNSEFSWLMPWYDNQHTVLYTQHSIHHSDSRLQTNHGVGIRQFQNEAMFGLNAFYDYDISQYHSRLGLGTEYWQDYLKLSANHYFPLSSWRAAKELNHDYNAKPARGWDLHAEGWLPTYPNIGATLKYEQYYGNEVGLFGKDQRQNNPFAATVGLNWTPFPLITLSTEHKIGNSGLSNTQANIHFTWQFSKNFAQHLEPSEVNEMRQLSRTRYDFVQRNNNIVLQYQKRNLISLVLKPLIRSTEGTSVSMIQRIDSKYPLDKVSWQAPELILAGGRVDYTNANLMLKLPAYKAAATPQETQQKNHYRLTAIAYDNQGNASPQVETFIDVIEPTTINAKPVDVVQQGSALANGKDINTLKVTLRDNAGNILPDTPITFVLPAELKLAQTSSTFYNRLVSTPLKTRPSSAQRYSTTTDHQGEASVQYTAHVAGQYNITALPKNGTPVISQVTIKPSIDQIRIAEFTIIDDNALANGTATNKAKVHITDTQGQPVAGTFVDFTATHGATITPQAITDRHGDAEVTLTSNKIGHSEVTATTNGESKKLSVNFTANSMVTPHIIETSPMQAGEEGVVTFELKDANKQLVTGFLGDITLSIDGIKTITPAKELIDKKGSYTVTVPKQTKGHHQLIIIADNQPSQRVILDVSSSNIIPANHPDGSGPKGEKGVVENVYFTKQQTPTARSGHQFSLDIILEDAFGHRLSGVNLDNAITHTQQTSPQWRDNKDGTYNINLLLDKLGDDTLKAVINQVESQSIAINVIPQAGDDAVNSVNIALPKQYAHVGDQIDVVAYLYDNVKNGVIDVNLKSIQLFDNDTLVPAEQLLWHKNNVLGTYSSKLQLTQAGKHHFKIAINSRQSQELSVVVDKADNAAQVSKVTMDVKETNLEVGESALITLTLIDQYNHGVVGLNNRSIDLHDDQNVIDNRQLSWEMESDGVYTTSVPMTKTGLNTITAIVNGKKSVPIKFSIFPPKDSADIAHLTLTSPTLSLQENGQVKLVLIATDQYGNGVTRVSNADITLTDNIDSHSVILPTHWQNDQSHTHANRTYGVYSTNVTLQGAGKHRLTVSVNGITAEQEIQVTPSTTTASNITLEVIKDYAIADGIDTNKVRVHITDEQGHPIKGAKITASSSADIRTPPLPTDLNGYTEINLSYTIKTTSVLLVSLDGKDHVKGASVHFVAGPPSQIIMVDKIYKRNDIGVRVLDTTGNFVSGLEKKLKVFIDDKPVDPQIYEFIIHDKRAYIISFTSISAGHHQVEISVDGTSIKQKFDLNITEK